MHANPRLTPYMLARVALLCQIVTTISKMTLNSKASVKHVEKMLAMSGEKHADKAAADILALETKIATIQWSKVENRNPVKTYNKLDMAKLAELTPGFDWSAYFAGTGVGKKVNYVIVRQPSFMTDLAKL